MALPGGACTVRPVFSPALWRALLPCLSSFAPIYLGSLLVEPTLPLCGDSVTTERHCTRAPFRVRDVCRRWHRVPLLGPRASTLSAANLFFLPPTHNRRRGPAQGYRRPILCRLFWLWIDRRVPTNVGSLCLSLFSARVILLSSHLELVAATVTLPFFPRYSSFSC